MPLEVSFSSVFTARSARTIYDPTPYEEHVGRYLKPQSVRQGSLWLGCLWGIAAPRPDAVAGMKKPIGSV